MCAEYQHNGGVFTSTEIEIVCKSMKAYGSGAMVWTKIIELKTVNSNSEKSVWPGSI